MSRAVNGQRFKTPLTSIARLSKRPSLPVPYLDSASPQRTWQEYWNAEYARQMALKGQSMTKARKWLVRYYHGSHVIPRQRSVIVDAATEESALETARELVGWLYHYNAKKVKATIARAKQFT